MIKQTVKRAGTSVEDLIALFDNIYTYIWKIILSVTDSKNL